MSYTYGFSDNVSYGTDAVNSILKNLVSDGVNLFQEGVSYTPASLNQITNEVTEAGVSSAYTSSCRVENAAESGYLKILPGTAFFNDGSTITVDSDGVKLAVIPGTKNYIYFEKSTIDGSAAPKISTTSPGSGAVKLAEYNNGTITDCRTYAKSKISGFGISPYDVISLGKYENLNTTTDSWNLAATFGVKSPDYVFAGLRFYYNTAGFGTLSGFESTTKNSFSGYYISSDGGLANYHNEAELIIGEYAGVQTRLNVVKSATQIQVWLKSKKSTVDLTGALLYVV